jgi:hypothetical protein
MLQLSFGLVYVSISLVETDPRANLPDRPFILQNGVGETHKVKIIHY